ncbi:LDH2 family malate/lactate/ureidoglycolate dehydrogenase [Kribbella steppae]|uniref:LDH2 family malate/lactate/ureidoglycolate dehydrogenase n=1 Tax=Kribbella steppae TaxID=2512223 RepID=A0A4R2HWL3_9ACTN|nr:Ldh family oxidoreductase [Kribbella steppae]TCO35854.1 LDH2 family malate/lactate/ureidoglycolate dehydrogenase [Kribbella steppae]
MASAQRTRPEALLSFTEAVLRAEGVPESDAHLLADTLVTAELWGHASHGMLRLPWYVARLRSGAMARVTRIERVRDSGALVVLDGANGIGQVVTDHAISLGVERAREYGVSAIGVRNSGHFGTAAYFTRKAADQGCVALLSTNASPAMAPWGGRHKSIGTNPWSIAAPAGRHGTVVMDLANTAVARGKVYLAAERGTEIPVGWAADADGNPTTDPRRAIEGLILPMAGPKGYVMAFMFDVLAGVLTGSAFGADVAGPYQPDAPSGVGHLLLTIDIAAMDDPASYAERVEALVDATRSAETAAWADRILVPGELEDRNLAEHIVTGITLTATTWTSLVTLGAETQVDLPPTEELAA